MRVTRGLGLFVAAISVELLGGCGNEALILDCTGRPQSYCNTQPGGMCVSSVGGSFCAYPNENCPSHFVYGDHAGTLSGKCTGAVSTDENPDARLPDGGTMTTGGDIDAQPVDRTPPETSITSGPADGSVS